MSASEDNAQRCLSCGRSIDSIATEHLKIPRPHMNARDDDDAYEDEYEDDRPSRRSKRSKSREKPGKVLAIAIMVLVGGILACLNSGGVLLYFGIQAVFTMGFGLVCCIYPPPYYGIVLGIMAIMKGTQLIGEKGHLQPPPKAIAIMMIVNIINFDVPNLVMGILVLVFLSDPEVESYYKG
jgi:hypothetical protein